MVLYLAWLPFRHRKSFINVQMLLYLQVLKDSYSSLAFNTLERKKQADKQIFCEFQVNMIYVVSSKSARAT